MNRYEQLISQGIQASQTGQSDLAIEFWHEASQQQPHRGAPHFLIGSEHAAGRRLDMASQAMEKAVMVEPTLWIARFQWGLLELSSGNALRAAAVWQPLDALPEQSYLRCFRDGLIALSKEQFELAASQLQIGIENNAENEPLNHDMRMVMARIDAIKAQETSDAERDSNALLATFLASGYNTRH
jgi:tetratricopeptide (TPR) repeat protein